MPPKASATLCALALVACGGSRRLPPTPGCVRAARALDAIELVVGHTVAVPQPCPQAADWYIRTPLQLTATADGLRVQFAVADRAFHPGGLRSTEDARDVAVVFPAGEGPGRQTMELAIDATDGGYVVDDTLPWETWHLEGARGEFHFVCALYDRREGGGELETRISMHIEVRGATVDAP